jgi:hypothetical protein
MKTLELNYVLITDEDIPALAEYRLANPDTIWMVDFRGVEQVIGRRSGLKQWEYYPSPFPQVLTEIQPPFCLLVESGGDFNSVVQPYESEGRAVKAKVYQDHRPGWCCWRFGRRDIEAETEFFELAALPMEMGAYGGTGTYRKAN